MNKRIRNKIFWKQFTREQRAELKRSYDESFNPENWISHEEVMSKYAKYQKKPKSDGWSDLTVEQQNKLKADDTENFDTTNMVSHEEALKMIDRWLTEKNPSVFLG
jgi:superoxide dismutase